VEMMSVKPWRFTAINPSMGIAMKEPVQLAKILKKAKQYFPFNEIQKGA